jgi:hypothetical protein
MKQNALHFVIASETWQSRLLNAVGTPTHLYYLDSSLRSTPFRMTKQNAQTGIFIS